MITLNKGVFGLKNIDKSGAWGYFNGASQEATIRGFGGICYMEDNKWIMCNVGLGPNSNKVELYETKILLILAVS